MKAFVGVLLMLLQVSHGVERFCDGRENEAQCYGALGGAVDIKLQDSISGIRRLECRKNHKVIYRWINSTRETTKESKFLFFPSNGTVRINDLKRNDSGQHRYEMFDYHGKVAVIRIIQLFVQAPVSSVQLVSECLSQGQMKVYCLSDGDSPQYSWTLDGHTLTDSELLSGNNETNIIVLRQTISGRLVCRVRNQISNSFNQMNKSGCGVQRFCDGRENGAQCYGALGGAVDIKLQDSISGIRRLECRKNHEVIYSWINSTKETTKESKFLFFPSNGTVTINDLNWNDSGEHGYDMFDYHGKVAVIRIIQLFVQAPVSSVQLVSECLSQGQMKVSCLSDGDSPQYSWTLDGHTLTDSELLSGNNESNIIVLRQTISGRLVCRVRNQISNSFNQINISGCGLSHLAILGLRATVVILPLIGMSLYFIWRRKKYGKPEDCSFPRNEES